MNTVVQIADRYIATWNETDAGRRQALLAEAWAEGATYTDPLAHGKGRNEIGALIMPCSWNVSSMCCQRPGFM